MSDCNCGQNKAPVLSSQRMRGMFPRAPKCKCQGVIFTTKTVPASLGDSSEGSPYAPKNGLYFNTLLKYESDKAVYLFDSAGVPTCLREAERGE